MNAQDEWKQAYRDKSILNFTREQRHHEICWGWVDLIKCAALERKLAAAQREIERLKLLLDMANYAVWAKDYDHLRRLRR